MASRFVRSMTMLLIILMVAACGGTAPSESPTTAAPAADQPTAAAPAADQPTAAAPAADQPTAAAPAADQPTAAAPAADTGTTAPAAGADLKGKLTMTFWGNEVDIKTQKDSVDKFMKLHPGVQIEVLEGNGCGADYAACKTMIAGGNMPDVFVPGIWNYNRMADDGVLTDLTDYMASSGVKIDDFSPNVIQGMKALSDGKIYGLPMGYNVQSLYYNKDMFDKAGIPYPPADGSYTWDDLRGWAKKLTLDQAGNSADSPTFDPAKTKQWGFATWATVGAPPGYEPVLLAYGGSAMTLPDRQKCNMESEGSIKGWQFIQDMIWKDHSTVNPEQYQEQAGWQRWIAGQVAMQQGSHEQVGLVAQQNPSLKFDMAALPKGPAGNATVIQMHIWSIYKNSPNKDLAWEFVKWVSTEGSGTQMGLVPAYKDFASGELFVKKPGEPAHVKEAQLDPTSWKLTTFPSTYSQRTDELNGQDGFGPAITEITSNEKPAAEALSGVCEKVNALMQR